MLLLSFVARASALPLGTVGLEHFGHEAFTREDGAPTAVNSIAQTPDGYLWLAAKGGLWRYDGSTFEQIEAPSGASFAGANAEMLLVTKRGELWVGYGGSGGVAVYRGGHLVDAKLPDPPPHVIRLAEGSDGTIYAVWGGISSRMWGFRAGHWRLVDTAMGLPPGYILDLKRTQDGALWAAILNVSQDNSGLAVLPPGASRFLWRGGSYNFPNVAEDPSRRLWVADRERVRPLYGEWRPQSYRLPPGVVATKVAFDQWGGLWLATNEVGLLRVADTDREVTSPSPRIAQFRRSDGLSSDMARTVFVDREGTIWVGTDEGLDRFRFSDISMVTALRWSSVQAISFGRSADGTAFLSVGDNSYRLGPGAPTRVAAGGELGIPCSSAGNGSWFNSPSGVGRLDGARISDSVAPPSSLVVACARDARGRLWLIGDDRTIWSHDTRGWHRMGQDGDLLFSGSPLALNATSDIAYTLGAGAVAVVSGDHHLRYALDPLKLGKLQGVDPAGADFLVPMDAGVVRLRGGRAVALRSRDYPWLSQVVTTVTSTRGVTWFYGRQGLSLVRTADLERAFAHPGMPLPHRTFGTNDGLPEDFQHPGFEGSQAAEGGDGRLWLATGNGVATIDPRQVSVVPRVPPVLVRSLGYGATVVRDPADPVLPPGTSSIRITYAGLQLAASDRMTFQFMLDGVDPDWINAGARRATNYTNLAPGDYRFRVRAMDANGTWSESATTFHFVIEPTFTQTWTFRLICIALVLTLLWMAYRVKVRTVAANVRARMAERLDERERIARELHDTLLQSINALILHVQVVTDGLPQDDKARQALEGALDRAQDAVVEGRERVEALRLPGLGGNLEDILVRVAHIELGPYRIRHSIETVGEAQRLEPLVSNEIAQIAKEIFFNVVRHAAAGQVDVEIVYERRSLTVRFADDGKGMDPDVLRAGFRTGHFGLVGMRERASKLNGSLSFSNRRAGGLAIVVEIPATVAYRNEENGPLARFLSSIGGFLA